MSPRRVAGQTSADWMPRQSEDFLSRANRDDEITKIGLASTCCAIWCGDNDPVEDVLQSLSLPDSAPESDEDDPFDGEAWLAVNQTVPFKSRDRGRCTRSCRQCA